MADGSLDGRVALMTGGSRGIGQAIAWSFVDEGADVGIVGRDEDALAETMSGIEERGQRGLSIAADVTDVPAIPRLFDRIEGELGESDLLVVSPGVQGDRPALEYTEAGSCLASRQASCPCPRIWDEPPCSLPGQIRGWSTATC